MSVDALDFGQSIAGLLIDGVEETAFAGATLRMDEKLGVRVEVPYVDNAQVGQFEHVQAWFRDQAPPSNMELATPSGMVSMFDIRWSGHSSGGAVSLGTLAPNEVVLHERDGPLTEPLVVDEVRSRVDGLREWTRLTALDTSHELDGEGRVQRITVTVESPEAVTWQQGAATMTLRTDWRTSYPEDGAEGGMNILDSTVLTSRFDSARPFLDHLVEQKKVVNLLVLLFGTGIYFREHRVQHATFTVRTLDGVSHGNPFVELLSSRTIRERLEPMPTRNDFVNGLAGLTAIGPAGLQRWSDEYTRWERFILPAAGVLGRRGFFQEDIIVSNSQSLEAAGQLLGARDGEAETYWRGRPTTATYVYRCLHVADLTWSERATSILHLARAIANTYNDIKHFDRGNFPEAAASDISAAATKLLVRAIALQIVDPSNTLHSNGFAGPMWMVSQRFDAYAVRVDDRGKFVPDPAGNA